IGFILLAFLALSAAVQAQVITITYNTNASSRAVAVNPVTGRVFVAISGGGLDVFDDTSFAHVTLGGNQANYLAVDPSTNRVYTAQYSGQALYMVDAGSISNGTNDGVTTINLSAIIFGVAVNPVTGKVYVAHRNSNLVSIIDTRNG